MARIIYGVCGEGMGHATRSKPIIEHLSKKHKVKIFCSGKSLDYLSKKFNYVDKADGIFLYYKNNGIDEIATVINNVSNVPALIKSLKKVMKAIDDFKPRLIISDYDIITAYAGLLKGIPVISIDNQHICGKSVLKYPKRFWINYLQTRLVNRLVMPFAEHYFVATFFYPEIRSKDVSLVPPILRNNILKMKRHKGKHFIVYQTSDTNKQLIKTLKGIDEKFVVYGFNKEKKDGNLIFRKFKKGSEKKFLKDLSECKAVITNGGFTLMTEALYLGKPVLSIPVKRQFEQITNAVYLNRLGYGKKAAYADRNVITDFISDLRKYEKKLKNYKKENNSKMLRMLDNMIRKV